MPTPAPFIPAQRTTPVWESHKLFREAHYQDGTQWTSDDEDGDDPESSPKD